MATPTKADFDKALKTIGMPHGRQIDFLREHVINLQYGLLARKIGKALGRKNADLTLLVDFVRPKSVTNDEWIMVMHPQFATALKQARWI